MGDSEIHVEYKRLKKPDTNFNIVLLRVLPVTFQML